jgi:cobalamin synthase
MSDETMQEHRRQTRRRFAMAAFVCAVVETVYLLGWQPELAAPVVGWTYGLWGAIITGGLGFDSWADVAKGR